jgi:hypothetical protein
MDNHAGSIDHNHHQDKTLPSSKVFLLQAKRIKNNNSPEEDINDDR